MLRLVNKSKKIALLRASL